MSNDSTPRATPHDPLSIWQQHTLAEFVHRDADAAVATMTDDAYVLLAPPKVSAVGKAAVRDFYANVFLQQLPADLVPVTISRLVGHDALVEEAVYSFTHDIAMDWMLPGIAPTGRRVEVAVIGIIGFRAGKVAYERLHWDQATVLRQLGIIDPSTPATAGADAAQRVVELGGVLAPG